MSDQLAAASAALGVPEELLRRAAEARAAADGIDVDALIAAWAGGAPAPEGAAPASSAPVEPTDEPASIDGGPTPEPEIAAPEPAPAAAPAMPTGALASAAPPPAATVSGAAALDYEAVVTVPTAGLSERTAPMVPRWLTALFVIAPLAGLVYLITFVAGPNCGTAGQLTVDRLTGAVVNCDGTEFAAAGGPGGVDIRGIIAEGSGLYSAAPGNCASCHGSGGGGGTGPALNGGAVLSTFAACTDHIEWVLLGTQGFQAAGIDTYGDNGTAVGGGGIMPGFQSLSEDQLAAVVFFERVQFGGQDPAAAAEDCGYIDPGGEDGENGEDAATDEETSALDE